MSRKTFRYYYWLTKDFLKKYGIQVFLSSFITLFVILSIHSFAPYIKEQIAKRNRIIGIVGSYTEQKLPDEIQSMITTSLLVINQKGEYIPILAEGWKSSKDNTIFTITLKKNLVWDDNEAFNAHNVQANFKDVTTTILNDFTIKFTLSRPLATFPRFLTSNQLKNNTIGIGGQYRISSLQSKLGIIQSLSLTPKDSTKSPVRYRMYPSESLLIYAYKAGLINEMRLQRQNAMEEFSNWNNSTVISSVNYQTILTLFFNFNKPFFQERGVRKGIELAIDRKEFDSLGIHAYNPIPMTSWAYKEPSKSVLFDREQSITLLSKYTSSNSAQLQLYSPYEYLGTADIISRLFKQIGVNVAVSIITDAPPSDFDLLLAPIQVSDDPDQYYYWHSLQPLAQFIGYKNLKLDKYLEDGRQTINRNERLGIYEDFQKNIADDLPGIFLYHPYQYTISRK